VPQFIVAFIAEALIEALPVLSDVAITVIANVVGYGITGLALTAIGRALAPGIPSPAAGAQAVLQPIPPRIRGYGVARLAGAFMFDEAKNNFLYLVFALHDGRIDSFGQWYMNDDRVAMNPAYDSGPPAVVTLPDQAYSNGRIRVQTRLGLPTETAYASLVANADMGPIWDSTARGDGIASYYMACEGGRLQDFPTSYPNGKPQPSNAARLACVYDWRDVAQSPTDETTWKWSANPIVCLINDLWTEHAYDWDREIAPNLASHTAEADVCDQTFAILNKCTRVNQAANATQTNIVLEDVTGLSIGMTFYVDSQAFVVTSFTSDPPLGTNVGWSGTGLAAAVGVGAVARWKADPGSPGSEPRYQVNGFYNQDNALSDIVTSFLQTCDGWMSRDGAGAIVVRAGHYYDPTVTLTAADITDYAWQSYVVEEQACNTLRVQFCSPANDYSVVDTDDWADEDDIAARGGEAIPQPFTLNWVQSNGQARRLAKREMSRRLAATGTIKCKLSGLRALGERYIRVQLGAGEIDELAEAVVEVTDAPEIGDDGMSITFTVRTADPNIDAWNAATEEGDGPSTGTRIVGEALIAPTVTSAAIFFDGSTLGVRLRLVVVGPARNDLTWAARWRISGGVSWNEANYSDADPGGGVTLETGFVAPDTTVEYEVAYLTGAGSLSPWSTLASISTSTAAEPPSVPTGITATGGEDSATIGWRNPSSFNFSTARVYRAASGAGFGAAVAIGTDLVGALGAIMAYVDAGIGAGAYDYFVVGKNAAGVASSPDGPATATVVPRHITTEAGDRLTDENGNEITGET
jgi:hypothetical protein